MVFKHNLLLSVISLSLMAFLGIYSGSSLAMIFPNLMKEFNVAENVIQFVVSGYLLTIAITIPLTPFLISKFHTKKLFVLAIILFAFGIIQSVFASNFYFLVVGRLLMAVSVGIVLPLTMNLILVKSDVLKRGIYLGVISLIINIAPILGPITGTYISEIFGWRYIFILMTPLLIISFIFGIFAIDNISNKENVKKLDLLSFFLISFSFVSIIIGISKLNDIIIGLSLIILGLLFFIKFLFRQRKIENPLIAFSIFKNKNYVLGIICVSIVLIWILTYAYSIPMIVQFSLHEDSITSALVMLPGAMLSGILSPIIGKFYPKINFKIAMVIGYSIIISALFFFYFSDISILTFLIGYTFFLIGVPLIQINNQTNALNSLSSHEHVYGTAFMNSMQQVSGGIGMSVASIILSRTIVNAGNLSDYEIYFSYKNHIVVFLFIVSVVGLFISLNSKKANIKK